MWFQTSATAATRQFQLARLYAELAAPDAIEREAASARCSSSPTARRLAYRALGSYLAGAMVFPYARFLADAEAVRYDIEALRQIYTASFEQVAHRLVTLRKPGAEGVPFGFLRSDPAGRLTKHFPLPGLLLPNSRPCLPALGDLRRLPHARDAGAPGGAVFRWLALPVHRQRPGAAAGELCATAAIHTSVMLACDVLHADRTVYGAGLDLGDADGRRAGRPELPALHPPRLRRPPGGGAGARRPAGRGPGAPGAAAFRSWRTAAEYALNWR